LTLNNQNKKVFGGQGNDSKAQNKDSKEFKKAEPLKFAPGVSKDDNQGNVFGVNKTAPKDDSKTAQRKAKAELLFGKTENVSLFGGNKPTTTNAFGPGTKKNTTTKPVQAKPTTTTQGNDLFGAPAPQTQKQPSAKKVEPQKDLDIFGGDDI